MEHHHVLQEKQREEQSLRHANAELEQRVDERTRELVRVDTQLSSDTTERLRIEEELGRQARKSGEEHRLQEALRENTPGGITVTDRTGLLLRDISDRKKIEQELRDSEKNYRELVEGVNCIVLRMTPDGKIAFINDYGARLFGYRKDELTGKEIIGTILAPVDSTGKNLTRMLRDILKQTEKYTTNENENITKSGERLWIQWTNRVVTDQNGNVCEYLATGIDVTYRNKMEEKLRRREKEFRTLLENLPDPIAVFGRDYRVLYINAAVEKYFGHTLELLRGKTSREAGFDQRNSDIWEASLSRVFANGKEDVVEYTYEHNGVKRVFVGRCVPLFAADGSVESAITINLDMTDMYRSRDELKRARDIAETHRPRMAGRAGAGGRIGGPPVSPQPAEAGRGEAKGELRPGPNDRGKTRSVRTTGGVVAR
jgi:PAS domain S-box-containing protein